jgi:hypothetical protein
MFIGFNACIFGIGKTAMYANVKEIAYVRSDKETGKAVVKLTTGDVYDTDEDFANFILKIEETEKCRESKKTGKQ